MAVTVATLKAVVDADITGLASKMKQADTLMRTGKKNMEDMAATTNRLSQSFAGLAGSIKLAIGAGAATLFTQGVRKMVGAASDLGDAMSKVDTIFGKSADSVKKWSENTDKALGVSQKQALDTAATIGQLYQNMGIAEKASAQMSTKLVQLATDLGALNNRSTEDTLERIQRGVRGSAEALDELGLSFNANMVKQKAYQMGLAKQGAALTEASKAQAIFSLMMQQGAKAAGQFARESDTLAAQTKMLQAEVDNLAADLGKELVPVIRDLVKWVREDLLPEFKKFGEWAVQMGKDLPVLGKGMLNLIDPTNQLAGAGRFLADSFKAAGSAFSEWMGILKHSQSSEGQISQLKADLKILGDARDRALRFTGKATPGGLGMIRPIGFSMDETQAAARYGQVVGMQDLAGGSSMSLANAYNIANARLNSIQSSANLVKKMEAAQGKGNDQYYGRGQTRTGLPDLGTPTPTPQPTGTGKGKTRKGRSTFSAPNLDPSLTIGAFLPFGDFDALIERGRSMYLEYLAFLEERGRKAVSLVGGVTEQISGLISGGINQMFNDHTAKMQERGKKALAITSEAATAATAALTGSVTAMWETANKEAERHRKISEDFMRDIEQTRRKQLSNQQGEPEKAKEIDAFFTNFTRTARQSSRELLRSILGGRGRDRADVFREFFDGMKNAFVDALVNSPMERLKKIFEPIADNFGKLMQEALVGAVKVAQSGVGQMLGAVYQLLSAMNRKGGLNFGSILGGIAAGVFLGPAAIPFGLNAGGALYQGDIGGAAVATAGFAATGGFGSYGGGSGGGNGLAPRDFNPNDYTGRAQNVQNIYIQNQNINDRADSKRLAAEFNQRLENQIRSGVV